MTMIVRCSACGKATVVVSRNRAESKCSRCGQPLAPSAKVSRSDPEGLEARVREQLYGPHGLGRPR